ncbi:hypothetical protein ACFWBC_31705 [Streptomyces sp. NPDC059985]|uniref:hypothetical protein n=1 Tax=Streptomyces sp. NPDC059985 TaxID=3347025 RepID=UPI00369260B6
MRRPSVPEDLDPAGRLWARAVTFAVLAAARGDHEEYWLDEDGVWGENGSGSFWWRMRMCGADRAVFCGQDADGSYTHVGPEPLDFLAGGPDWLPWERLREDAAGNLFGFVYWWENGAWHRVDYREGEMGDGLDGAAPWADSVEEFLDEAECVLGDATRGGPAVREAVSLFAGHAERRTVDGDVVGALLKAAGTGPEGDVLDADAALGLARRAGVTA